MFGKDTCAVTMSLSRGVDERCLSLIDSSTQVDSMSLSPSAAVELI